MLARTYCALRAGRGRVRPSSSQSSSQRNPPASRRGRPQRGRPRPRGSPQGLRTVASARRRVGVGHGAAQVGEAARAAGRRATPRGPAGAVIDAQVSKVSPNPDSVTPGGPRHPSSASVASSHSWADRVATVGTWSTMSRHAGSAATSSAATCGTIPTDTARTATSKSSPGARASRCRSRAAAPVRSPGRRPGSAVELVHQGPAGQHGSPPTRTSGSYRGVPRSGSACRVSSTDADRPVVRRAGAGRARRKNRNSTPRRTQRLVQRREHDLAHAGLHPPEDGALEVEEHPPGELDAQPGREARPRAVPVARRRT